MKETPGPANSAAIVRRILFWNLLCFISLFILFMITAFIMGTNAQKYGTDAGLLFVFMIVVHLFVNYFIVRRQQQTGVKALIISTLLILAVYMLMLFH